MQRRNASDASSANRSRDARADARGNDADAFLIFNVEEPERTGDHILAAHTASIRPRARTPELPGESNGE
jgi:hypothetical protein